MGKSGRKTVNDFAAFIWKRSIRNGAKKNTTMWKWKTFVTEKTADDPYWDPKEKEKNMINVSLEKKAKKKQTSKQEKQGKLQMEAERTNTVKEKWRKCLIQ